MKTIDTYKKLFFLLKVKSILFFLLFVSNSYSQGVGFGTTAPSEIIHMSGSSRDIAIRMDGVPAAASNQDVGPEDPTTTGDDGTPGYITWSSTGNVISSNDAWSTATSDSTSKTSHYIRATNYDFSAIPGGATINGITVEVERSASNTNIAVVAGSWATSKTNYTVGAGSNRVIVLICTDEENNAWDNGVDDVSWGGQALIEIDQEDRSDDIGVHMWYLDEAKIQAAGGGTNSFVVNWDGGDGDEEFQVVTLENVNQENPVTAFDTEDGDDGDNDMTLPTTFNIQAGDFVIYGASNEDDGETHSESGVYTEQRDSDVGNYRFAVAYATFASATTSTPVANFSGNNDKQAMVAAQFNGLSTVVDNVVSIVKGGSVVGSNKAIETEWPSSDATATYGGSSDLWGTTWVDTDINGAGTNFGVVVSSTITNNIASIDHIKITVNYTDLSGATSWVMGIDDSDGGDFVVSKNTTLGTNNFIHIGTNGDVGIGRTSTGNNLEVEGTASNTAGSAWGTNSDRRIKKEIKNIDNSFETILKLRPVTYKYTKQYLTMHPNLENREYSSFIAQEFKEVFPNCVKRTNEFLPGCNEGILQINISDAQIVTIKAVQELIKLNQKQAKTIVEMEAKIKQLETMKQDFNLLKAEVQRLKNEGENSASTK